MTNNQINYAKHLENVRHNKKTEGQTDRSLKEGIRHNVAQENIGMSNVSLGYSNLDELYRHNQVLEGEQSRHNLATEEQAKYDTDMKYFSQLDKHPLAGLGWYAYQNRDKVVEGFTTFSDYLQGTAQKHGTNNIALAK